MADSFPEKYTKVLNKLAAEFMDSANGKTAEELRKEILKAEEALSENAKLKEADTKLNSHKDMVRELGAVYRENSTVANAKIKYAIYLIEGRGETVSKK
jgi:hypothetical protein